MSDFLTQKITYKGKQPQREYDVSIGHILHFQTPTMSTEWMLRLPAHPHISVEAFWGVEICKMALYNAAVSLLDRNPARML